MVNNLNTDEPGLKKYLLITAISTLFSIGIYLGGIYLSRLLIFNSEVGYQNYAIAGLCFVTLVIWVRLGFYKTKIKPVGEMVMINFLVLNWVSFIIAVFYSLWFLIGVIIVGLFVYLLFSPHTNKQCLLNQIRNRTLYRWSIIEALALAIAVALINSQFNSVG